MKKSLLLLLFSMNMANAQQSEYFKMGGFGDFSAHFGYNLSNLLGNNKDINNLNRLEDNSFSYGFSAQVGYRFSPSFAVAGGAWYHFIEPKFHILQIFAQPYWLLNKPEKGEDWSFLSAKLGKQINQTAVSHSTFVGVSVGRYDFIKKNIGHKFEVGLDWHHLNDGGVVFVGLSYGIFILK